MFIITKIIKSFARIFDSELETVMRCIEDVDDCIGVVERCFAIGYNHSYMFDVGKLIKFYQSKIFRGSISNLKFKSNLAL